MTMVTQVSPGSSVPRGMDLSAPIFRSEMLLRSCRTECLTPALKELL